MDYFIDFEFNPSTEKGAGSIITMAMVSEIGTSFYLGLGRGIDAVTDPWIKDNVMPIIDDAKMPLRVAMSDISFAREIEKFLKDDKDINIIADWPIDIAYFCNAILTGPGTMINIPGFTTEVHRVNCYPTTLEGALQHNAHWDALALQHYFKQIT